MPAVLGLSAADAAAAAALALASHFIFARIELWPARLFPAWAALYSGSVLLVRHTRAPLALSAALGLVARGAVVYVATLLLSIGVYRVLFHRCCAFPGPTSCALSKWATVPVDAAGQRARYVQRLHSQYGDIVRTGPRELSINDPSVIAATCGAQSKCSKGPWYAGATAGKGRRSRSLHTTTIKADHAARRRIWDGGFNARSLRSYEPSLLALSRLLVERMGESAARGEKVEVDEWAAYYGFDVMGQVGFSSSFECVENGKLSEGVQLLQDAMAAIQTLSNVPYLGEIARYLPSPIVKLEDWVAGSLRKRMDDPSAGPDVFKHLLEVDQESGWKHNWEELRSDAMLQVVAGSDTASTTLAVSFYYLLTHDKAMEALRKELHHVFKGAEPDNFDALAKECRFLNAVINESLRLWPPVASGLQRVTPAEGLTLSVAGKQLVVPGDVIVTTPTFLMQRDPRNFAPHPEAFRPERWLAPEHEENFNLKAFNPFSYGPESCIGRHLAFMEIRIAVAQVVHAYDMELLPEFSAEAFEAGIVDFFTAGRKKKLPIKLTPRR